MAGLMGKYAAFLTRRPVLGNMISSAVSKIRTMDSARREKKVVERCIKNREHHAHLCYRSGSFRDWRRYRPAAH